MSSFSSPLVFFFVDVFFEAFFVLCWKILFATKSLWCVKKEQLFCSFARRFFLETTLMGVLFFFWDALFCFFAQQNVAILPKKLRFTLHAFLFFLKQISKAFLFSFLRERRKTFLAKVDFSEQRMLFEEETCWTRFRFHKSCFFNLIFSKERQHVCLNLLFFFFECKDSLEDLTRSWNYQPFCCMTVIKCQVFKQTVVFFFVGKT